MQSLALPESFDSTRDQGDEFRRIDQGDRFADRLILPEVTANSDPSWFGFLLTVREGAGFTRDRMVSHLEAKGVQTRMLFAGNLIKHPCFEEMRKSGEGYRVAGTLENTDRIMRDTFWIGVYPGMTDGMLNYMIEKILESAGK